MIFRKIKSFIESHPLATVLIPSLLLPLCYSLYTNHIWEDFFITFKFSKNLCEGNGLVYEPGQKVHGFTSPLGTLLPALCHYVTGAKSYEAAIWLFRIVFCIPAFAGASYFIFKTFRLKYETNIIPAVFALLLLVTEAKSIVFSMNGMETALMLFFLSWSFYLLQKDFGNWIAIGISWAGLMWTRPDSFIPVAGLILAFILFSGTPWRKTLPSIIKACLVTTVLYLPWFAWAWSYYGSPIPHTVIAKGAMAQLHGLEFILVFLRKLPVTTSWIFAPVYPQFPGWPPLAYVFASFAGAFCFIYWMMPYIKKDSLGRTASFIFFLYSLYFAYMPFPYPWYMPPAAFFGIVAIISGVYNLCLFFKREDNRRVVPQLMFLGFLLVSTALLFLTSLEMKIQQKLVENGNRKKIGEWFSKNAGKNDRIYLEALGYIGYFSERKILDFPGLVSPEVVKVVKEEHVDYAGAVEYLKPEWIAARILDHWSLITSSEYFRENYQVVEVFDVSYEIERQGYIPGEWYLLYDSCFYISKRK